MKRKDLLIPLVMLAVGAGIGFWTRNPQPPATGATTSAVGTHRQVTPQDDGPTHEDSSEAKSAPTAPGRPASAPETNMQGSPGSAGALPPLNTKVADVYEQLKDRAARGDGRAACRLAIELQQCADRDFALEGADRAAQLLKERGAPVEGQAKNWEERRVQLAQQQIDYAFALDERCKDVSTAQLVEHADLWRRAALTGHVPSMVFYARGDGFRMRETLDDLEQLAQYKREAERLMRAAAAAGSVEAAQQLKQAYEQQRGAWAGLFQQAVRPDIMESLTLMELAELRDYAPVPNWNQAERWNRNAEPVEGRSERFTMAQWDEAKRRAAERHKRWAPADDSSGYHRSPWERQEHARASCGKDQFTKLE